MNFDKKFTFWVFKTNFKEIFEVRKELIWVFVSAYDTGSKKGEEMKNRKGPYCGNNISMDNSRCK